MKLENFQNTQNKEVYLLTPTGLAAKTQLAKRFLKRRLEEYEALKAEIEALTDEVGDRGLGLFNANHFLLDALQ